MMAQDDEFAQPSAQEVEKAAEAFHETKPCEDARQDQGLEDTPLAASISARMLGAGDDEDQDEEGGSQSPSQVTPAFNLPAYSPSAQPATEAVQDNWDDEPLAPLPGYVARPSNSSCLTTVSSSSRPVYQDDAESRLDQSLENMEIMRIQTQAEREAREEIDLLKAECERSASAAGRAQADAEKLLTRLELEEQDCRKALHELAVDLMPSSEDDNLEHRPQACKGEQVDAEDNCDAEIFAGVQHGGVLFGRTV
jgi:hypothetical protein